MLSRSLPGQWRLSEMAVIGPAHRETGDKLALVCQRTRDQHLAARHPRRYMAQTGRSDVRFQVRRACFSIRSWRCPRWLGAQGRRRGE